jgi:protein-tyrosine-phosphatase
MDLADLPPRKLQQVAEEGDFVVTVCDNAHEGLTGLGGVHWSVPDPLRLGTEEAFEKAFDDIAHRISDLAPRVLAA